MDKYKVLTISVIVLALLNLATLGFMWTKSHKGHRHNKAKMCCADKKGGQCKMDGHHKKGAKCEGMKGPHKGGQKCDQVQGHHKGKGKKGMMSGKLIGKRLGFSEEQQAQLKSMSETHFEKIKEFHSKKKELKKELIGLLQDETNTEKRANLISQSTELEKEILLHKMDHFSAIKGICTPEQTEKFYVLIQDMGGKMHGKRNCKTGN